MQVQVEKGEDITSEIKTIIFIEKSNLTVEIYANEFKKQI